MLFTSNEVAGPGDLIQGKLADTWFLSACSIVASSNGREELLARIFDADALKKGYAGIGMYVVHFYKGGQWRIVIVVSPLATLHLACRVPPPPNAYIHSNLACANVPHRTTASHATPRVRCKASPSSPAARTATRSGS